MGRLRWPLHRIIERTNKQKYLYRTAGQTEISVQNSWTNQNISIERPDKRKIVIVERLDKRKIVITERPDKRKDRQRPLFIIYTRAQKSTYS